VQDEITASVAGVIEPALTEAEQQRVLRKPPERLDAWEAYQRGLWHFYKYGPDENLTAQTFYCQAIALDPKFAPGHYGYSLSLFWDAAFYATRSSEDVLKTMVEEARLAVSLDDKDAMAHTILGCMLRVIGDWEGSIAEGRTALALNPNNACVLGALGHYLCTGGYPADAIDPLRQAIRASPQDPLVWLWIYGIGMCHFYSRDFEAAVETHRQVIRMRPGERQAHEMIVAALAYLGRLDEAREALDRARALFPDLLHRFEQRLPWIRPDFFKLRAEGLRLAAGETE